MLFSSKDLTRDFNAENQKLMTENNEAKVQLDKVLDEYKQKTKFYENELKLLTKNYEDTSLKLNEQMTFNQELTEHKSKLEREASAFKSLSEQQTLKISGLNEELEKSKFLYESTLNESQIELKVKLDQINKELNSKWSNILE